MRTAVALSALLLAACGERGTSGPASPATPPGATAPAPPGGVPPAGPLGERPPPQPPEIRPGDLPWVRNGSRDLPGKPPARATRALRAADVEDFVAVMRELGTPEGKRDGLDAILRRRGIEPAWWGEMSSRVTTAAIGVMPSRDAPVPATWEADLAVVAPHRERIRAAIAE